MNYFFPTIFDQAPNIVSVLTLSSAGNFKLGGSDDETVQQNRSGLIQELGFGQNRLLVPKQPHADQIAIIPGANNLDLSDAVTTQDRGWLLGVTIADCAALLIYDPKNQVVCAIHSGWRGSKAKITPQTIERLLAKFGSQSDQVLIYLSPMAQVCCYEVQADFRSNFDLKYFSSRDHKLYFDNQAVILDQLVQSGVTTAQIEIDPRCTIHDPELRSYRRDRDQAGRMLAAIGIKP